MKILALEFSSHQRSVALLDAGCSVTQRQEAEIVETGGRGVRAFSMIDRAAQQLHWRREQIDAIALGLGPGSYTGIRASISIAQGWQLASGVRLLGISSVAAMAAQAHATGLRGTAAVLIDAQRNEFYLGNFLLETKAWSETAPLELVTLEAACKAASNSTHTITPDHNCSLPNAKLLFPSARFVAQLAVARTDFLAGEALQPIYLRQPQFVKAKPSSSVPPP